MKINLIGHLVKTNPIKPNLLKAQMNVNVYVIEDYIKKDDFVVRINKPNSNPISSKPKMSANVYIIEDYENVTAFRPQKNKPKQTQFKPNLVRRRRIQKWPKSLAGKSGHTQSVGRVEQTLRGGAGYDRIAMGPLIYNYSDKKQGA